MGMNSRPSRITVTDFRATFSAMLSPSVTQAIHRRYHSPMGAPAKMDLQDFSMGMVYHAIAPEGNRAQHLQEITGLEIRNASVSQRLENLAPEVFQELMNQGLKTLADAAKDSSAFYQGLRLVGIDGMDWSVNNAVPLRKAKSSKGGGTAFAKVRFNVLIELGIHHPIAATIGVDRQSEARLSQDLWQRTPPNSLVLGDALYGNRVCIGKALKEWKGKRIFFLFRVPEKTKPESLQKLKDGSELIEVKTRQGTVLRLRQIKGQVRGRDGKKTRVTLWTDLMDEPKHGARKLLRLYQMRWEQEIAGDELRNRLHGGHLLKSRTLRTCAQELAALVLAYAILARVRLSVARQLKVPSLRVSFQKTKRYVENLWMFFELGRELFTEDQKQRLVQRMIDLVQRQLTPPRQKRSCPRAVRKPVSRWPKLTKNIYHHGDFQYEIISN
jgi:hypothetical protein